MKKRSTTKPVKALKGAMLEKKGRARAKNRARVKAVGASVSRGEVRGELTSAIMHFIAGRKKGDSPPIVAVVVERFRPANQEERRRVWRAIQYLEKSNRIKIDGTRGEAKIALTARGERVLAEEKIWELMIPEPSAWDEKWRLVMFDFPLAMQGNRHRFRAKLEDLGFVMYQRSVFVFPHECRDQVEDVAEWFGVAGHVNYIVANELDDEARLIQIFDLEKLRSKMKKVQ